MKLTNYRGWPLLFVLLLFTQCNNTERKAKAPDKAFATYISAFTSGSISKADGIRIRLASSYETALPGKAVDERIFEFRPHISGRAYWESDRDIVFKPSSYLPSDKDFKAKFLLYKLMDVPPDRRVFEFGFSTIKEAFSVNTNGLDVMTSDPRYSSVHGTLISSDIIDPGKLQNVLEANLDGKKLPVRWEHPEPKLHKFYVDSLLRTDAVQHIILSWDGSPAGIREKGEMSIEIPSINQFEVLNVKVVQQPDQYISIRFSDPVDPGQILDGLIRLDMPVGLKFSVSNNEVRAYPAGRQNGSQFLTVEAGIKSVFGKITAKPYRVEISFEEMKPAVRFLGNGSILPLQGELSLPFEAVNLAAVDVSLVKIFEDNIPQFFQVNELSGDYQLSRVGRKILQKTVRLDAGKPINAQSWNAFSLDLKELVKKDPGAIYRIELSFKKEYSLFHCQGETKSSAGLAEEDSWEDTSPDDSGSWDGSEYYSSYYYPPGYKWSERNNPCDISYYNYEHFTSRNILASNMGIIAKEYSGNHLKIAVTDLVNTNPLNGVEVGFYNYQQQMIGSVKTDNDGMADIDLSNKPYLLIARNGDQKAYLRLDDGTSLSLSKFDVSGASVQEGIKGMIYGDRGVWRPGDSLHLVFILEDESGKLPPEHPVKFELFNPRGQMTWRTISTSGKDGFYDFSLLSPEDAPTGSWIARVSVGNSIFTKTIRIETIKPNRLKIKLDFGNEKYLPGNKDIQGKMKVTWLHGAIAGDMKVEMDIRLSSTSTHFSKFPEYSFDDQSRSFYPDESTISGKLDAKGEFDFSKAFNVKANAPGMLKAAFTTRVFEGSGDFSTDYFSMPYSPFKRYVGMKVPHGDKWTGALPTDSTNSVAIVTVDADGKPMAVSGLIATVYKLNWRWWWDTGEDNLASYFSGQHREPLIEKTLSTGADGKADFRFSIKYPDWGRYLIRIEDPSGGHAASSTVYIDWPEWAGREERENPSGANMLMFTADKDKYAPGDKARITFPSGGSGRALMSIENGSRVLKAWWINVTDKQTSFDFDITAEMAPNVYASLTLLQNYQQSKNNLPLRLYGVIPIMVEDPGTRLKPLIMMNDELKPDEDFNVTVKEQDGRPMTFTLAIVDEGLLDLTRFKTPDPWENFYAREALGVRTWDFYDDVIGAYGGKIEQLFAIGGGEDALGSGARKARRFPPVVLYSGPFELKKGESYTHKFHMPDYVGSVRVMLVAGKNRAYGNAEKTCPVKKPLMILSTLPRVLAPGEEVSLPVTVFAMDKNVREVKVNVECNDILNIIGDKSKTVNFDQSGDKVIEFKLKVAERTGFAQVNIEASSANEKASAKTELNVRNPNPPLTEYSQGILGPGQSLDTLIKWPGMPGTNSGSIQLSGSPQIDFGRRLKMLMRYPYGCIEQITSAAFPQLYLDRVSDLDKEEKSRITENVSIAIAKICANQLIDGSFSYWPGKSEADEWATSYAGHFLLITDQKGYDHPNGALTNWYRYQKMKAGEWSFSTSKGYKNDLLQAYRLYTMALMNKPDLAAMNRLRNTPGISISAIWRLAAAYALAGQPEVAKSMTQDLGTEVSGWNSMNPSYGSDLRNQAMILETMVLTGEREKGFSLMKQISDKVSRSSWLSTQTTAYCLISLAEFIGDSSSVHSNLSFDLKTGNSAMESLTTTLPLKQYPLLDNQQKTLKTNLKNTGKGELYYQVSVNGQPLTDNGQEYERNIAMKVEYKDMAGKSIDVGKLKQGMDFMAIVSLRHPGILDAYTNLALSEIFPSGWEILNLRYTGSEEQRGSIPDYQDFRDDRVYTYFNLNPGEMKRFVILLNASYKGRFYLPAVMVEAMYDNSIGAKTSGKWVEVMGDN